MARSLYVMLAAQGKDLCLCRRGELPTDAAPFTLPTQEPKSLAETIP